MKLLQVTDCHLVAAAGRALLGCDTQAALEAVLDQALGEARPDLLVASGDLAHEPTEAVYRRFLATVRTRYDGPCLCLPGNHDLLAPMASADLPMADVTLAGWTILGLDSHVDEQTEGVLSAARRQDLKRRVRAAQGHVLVVTHHHLLPVGAPWLDKDCIPDADPLLEWLAAHAVRGVLFGHVHQAVAVRYADRLPLYGTPSSCFQFKPNSESFATDDRAPGYRWITLREDGALTSEVGWLARGC